MKLLSSDTTFTHGHDGEETWFGLLYLHERLVAAVDEALQAEHNLPLSWFEVLLRLASHHASGNPYASVSSIAGSVLLSSSRVSRVIEGLEKRGLVRRRPNERDGRVSEVALTEAGLALYKAADTTHRRMVNKHLLEKLSPEVARTIAQAWRTLLDEEGDFAEKASMQQSG